MENRITNSFKRDGDGVLVNKSGRIVAAMKNNPHFPDQALVLAAETATEEFQVAYNNASGRDKIMVSIKNDKRELLIQALTALAAYVTQVCKGDKTMLLNSGFDLAKEKGETELSPIGILEVETSEPGAATISIKKVGGAKAYLHQYTTESPTASTPWISIGSDNRQFRFVSLTSGTRYWFRVAAIGFKGQLLYSPPVARYIQ